LDPLRLNEQGSVLDAIARFPLRRIQHGAVIGTDNRLHDFINSLLHDAHWYVRLVACLESNTIERLVKQADDIYKTDVMCFPAGTPAALLGEYQQGLKAKTYGLVADLPAAAHDFVIPSVSQLLIPYDESVHRGNLVNPTASHVSGAVQWNEAEGETDEELALRLLDRIKPVQNAYSRVPGLDVTVA